MSGEQEAIASPDPSDADIFNAALADEPAAETTTDDQPQPRDESGRFAAKAQAEEEAAAREQAPTPQADDTDKRHYIPLGEHLSEREKRQAAERRADELERQWTNFQRQQQQQRQAQEAPQRPDPINEPEAFADYLEERATAQLRIDRINLTFSDLEEKMIEKGEGEVFNKAFEALEKAPKNVKDEVIATVNPAKAMLRWYRRNTLLTEAGDDPEGFINRKLEERLKDPEVRRRILEESQAEARSPGNRSTVVNLPPSLNRATGGSGGRQASLPKDDGDFFNDAVAGLRR